MLGNICYNTRLDNLGQYKITRLLKEQGIENVKKMLIKEYVIEFAKKNRKSILITALIAVAVTAAISVPMTIACYENKKKKEQLEQLEVHIA